MSIEVLRPTQLTAERQSTVVLKRLTSYLPEITPFMQEFYGFDPKTFKHSMLTASIASIAFHSFNQITRIVPEHKEGQAMEAIEIGCALHDIGKMGIEKNLELSYQALYPEKYGKASSGVLISANHDRRSDEARAIIQTHPLIGGYIVLKLLNLLQSRRDKTLTKDMYRMIASIAFNHHEKASDTLHIRGSYPRSNGYRPQTQLGKITHLFAECADMYEGMRSPRDYNKERNLLSGSFTPEAIGDILGSYLSPKLLTETFGLMNRAKQERIRAQILFSIMGAAGPLDSAITQKEYCLDGENVQGEEWRGTSIEQAHLVPDLVRSIFQDESTPSSWGWRMREFLEEQATIEWADKGRE